MVSRSQVGEVGRGATVENGMGTRMIRGQNARVAISMACLLIAGKSSYLVATAWARAVYRAGTDVNGDVKITLPRIKFQFQWVGDQAQVAEQRRWR